MIRDWKNGFLVPFDDIDRLKKRMEHFIQQPFITLPLGEYARCTYQKAAENWHYYEKHWSVYQYLVNPCQAEPTIFREKNDIFEQIPDFYRKKLLYSWPDEKEIEKRISAWIKDIWNIDALNLKYRPELSHHSFVWEFHINTNEYYVKNIYTTLNDLPLWIGCNSIRNICQRSHAYGLAVSTSTTLEIEAKNEQLCCFITKKQKSLSDTYFFKDYRCIMETIYQFDTTNSFKKMLSDMDTYTYAQLLIFAYDDSASHTILHKTFREILEKDTHNWELSISYGKYFFSHIIVHANGYQLLPSSSVCKAPLGIDIAIFLTEILEKFTNIATPQAFFRLLTDASEIFDISLFSMYCLCLLIKLLVLKKQYRLFQTQSTEEDVTFWTKLLLLVR